VQYNASFVFHNVLSTSSNQSSASVNGLIQYTSYCVLLKVLDSDAELKSVYS